MSENIVSTSTALLAQLPSHIADGDLVLRPWHSDDASALFPLAADPLVGPPAGWPPHKSVEESRQVINEVFSVPGTYCVTVAGKIVGCVGLVPPDDLYAHLMRQFPDDQRVVEIGYWIGRSYWRHGYATRAARCLLMEAFAHHRLDSVWGTHNTENAGSAAVMKNMGMREVSTIANVPETRLDPSLMRDEVVCRASRVEFFAANPQHI